MVYRTIGWVAAAIGVGCSAAVAVYYHFLQPLAAYPRQKYMLLVGLAVLFVWLAWGQVNRFLRPRLAEFSLPKKLFWAVTAGAVGVLLVWTIPVPPAPIWTAHRVKIVATGQEIRDVARFRSLGFRSVYPRRTLRRAGDGVLEGR